MKPSPIKGNAFYGSPWVTNCGMAYNVYEEDVAKKWSAIPDDTDILITHMPRTVFSTPRSEREV